MTKRPLPPSQLSSLYEPLKKKMKFSGDEKEVALLALRKLYVPSESSPTPLDNSRRPLSKTKSSTQAPLHPRKFSPIKDHRIKKRYFSGPMKKCSQLLEKLMQNEVAGPFNKGVSRKLVPDYYYVIRDPMDFGTIKKKISRKAYNRIEEFHDDVKLIFKNCYLYNAPNSYLRQSVDVLEKQFDRHYGLISTQAEAMLDKNYRITEENLATFHKERKKKKKSRQKKRRKKKKKKKKSTPKKKKFSASQKKAMVEMIPNLTESEQQDIIEIVRVNHKTTEENDGTVTLDLDSYESSTLKKLYEYCMSVKKKQKFDSSDDFSSESSDGSDDD